MLPFFKPKKGFQLAGSGGGGGGGSIDTSALANKTDLTAIILTGTTNTSGNVISPGTWFYLNGKPCIAKVDIASGATFTEGTNYEEKTIGSALTELNSNYRYYDHNLGSGIFNDDYMLHLYVRYWGANYVKISAKNTYVNYGGFNIKVTRTNIYGTDSAQLTLGFNNNATYGKQGNLIYPTSGVSGNDLIKVYRINGYYEIYLTAGFCMFDIDFYQYADYGAPALTNWVEDVSVESVDSLPSGATAETITW